MTSACKLFFLELLEFLEINSIIIIKIMSTMLGMRRRHDYQKNSCFKF